MKKRIFALLLAALAAGSATACSETPVNDETTPSVELDAAPAEEGGSNAETTEEDVLAAWIAEVPKEDYGGYEFTMLNNESNFAYTQMTAEELTGESINDAIYNRNTAVAEDLNIVITENLVTYSQVTTDMNTCIAAGDDTYSCFWNESKFVAPFAINGQLLNVNDISAIDLEKSWWNGAALADISIGDYQYFLVGDLHLMFKESFWMVGFNKNIIDENSLGDPYELVREGIWTLDQMKTYMETVALDLNGDGTMDGNDRFGVTCYSGCVAAFMIAGDETFAERGEDGVPSIITPDDRFYAVYEKLAATMFDTAVTYVCLDGKTQNIAQYENGWHGVFSSGHALFYLEPIGSLKKLRDMDAEFGIIPFPKYDETQEDYVSLIASYAAFCGIPVTSSDPQRTGVILENLSARSYGELREAYVNTTLNFKYIRDKESAEMLNLILDSGRFNLIELLGVTAPVDTLVSNATSANMQIASSYAKILNAASKLLDKNVHKLLKLD
ncbi:MAG: hypothetical protein ACI4V1_09280 [Eubacteriales bacterium]